MRQKAPSPRVDADYMSIENASCYEEWRALASQLDEYEGNKKWKQDPSSDLYDYPLLQARLRQLRELRRSGDLSRLLFLLRTTLIRNFGEMGNLRLYKHSHTGTKTLIEDFIEEVLICLETIANADQSLLEHQSKLETFVKLRQAFGRTALLLSGGGTFGMNHVGVLKALFETKLLPRIISGSSAGAIVASVLCTRTDDEIPATLKEFPNGNLNVFDDSKSPEKVLSRIARFLKYGNFIDIRHLTGIMRDLLGDMTFQEGYNRSRRILNICVSSSGIYEMPRLLNYITSPDVLIWSAVAASCSVPIIFSGQQLLIKNPETGLPEPWNPSRQSWIDGSVENDLPMARLSELFNVNHFIVSQVNPHVAPLLKIDGLSNGHGTWSPRITEILKNELMHGMNLLAEMNIFRKYLTQVKSVLSQKYSGDITILPEIPVAEFPKILANPTPSFLMEAMARGERATWPKIDVIRSHCAIELAIDLAVYKIKATVLFDNNKDKQRNNNVDYSRLNVLRRRSNASDTLPSSNLSVYKTIGASSKSTHFVSTPVNFYIPVYSRSQPATPNSTFKLNIPDGAIKKGPVSPLHKPAKSPGFRTTAVDPVSPLAADRSGTRKMMERRHQIRKHSSYDSRLNAHSKSMVIQ